MQASPSLCQKSEPSLWNERASMFILFSAVYLILTVRNDVVGYRQAVAAGKPALINSAFGVAQVLAGAPIYWLCSRRKPARPEGDRPKPHPEAAPLP